MYLRMLGEYGSMSLNVTSLEKNLHAIFIFSILLTPSKYQIYVGFMKVRTDTPKCLFCGIC